MVLVDGPLGVGKTHLVEQCVYEHKGSNSGGIFWVQAKSSDELKESYAYITEEFPEIRIYNGEDDKLNMTTWLSRNRNWLLVMDAAGAAPDQELHKYINIQTRTGGEIIYICTKKPSMFRSTVDDKLRLRSLDPDDICLDDRDRNGQTPLLAATENGHAAFVELLIGTGRVDFNVTNHDSLTPLSLAAKNGHVAVIKLLVGMGHIHLIRLAPRSERHSDMPP